jgi:hypothetical protein
MLRRVDVVSLTVDRITYLHIASLAFLFFGRIEYRILVTEGAAKDPLFFDEKDLSGFDKSKDLSFACFDKRCHYFRCQKIDGFFAIGAKLDEVAGALTKNDGLLLFECDLGLLLHQKRC